MMLSLDTAYRSFGGEVEASSTPTICRLSDSPRHQLSAIALAGVLGAVARSVGNILSKLFAQGQTRKFQAPASHVRAPRKLTSTLPALFSGPVSGLVHRSKQNYLPPRRWQSS